MGNFIDEHFGLSMTVIIGGAVGAVIGVFVLLGAWGDSISCSAQTRDLIIAHRWGFWSGCRVQTHEGWVPLDNYRVVGRS